MEFLGGMYNAFALVKRTHAHPLVYTHAHAVSSDAWVMQTYTHDTFYSSQLQVT